MSSFFSFQGRSSRKEYWLLTIGLTFISFAGQFASYLTGWAAIQLVVSLAVLVPILAISVKRAHDRGKSGWFNLVALIPLAGAIWLFVELGCLRGQRGANRFGQNPLGENDYAEHFS